MLQNPPASKEPAGFFVTMRVIKFSGTAIADTGPVLRAAAIVAAAGEPCVVVVSALAGVTDRLVQISQLARTGRMASACGILERLADRHRRVAHAAAGAEAIGALEAIERCCGEIRALIDAAAVLRTVSPAAHDAILAAGDVMGSRVVAAALAARGIPSAWIDARRVFVTSADHGSASPDLDRTAAALDTLVAPPLAHDRVPVLAGFVGATARGITTTMGRGASDLSAAIVGSHFAAREIQIWADRDGLPAADPCFVPGASRIPQLSYAEARELTYFGTRVVHPSAIGPAGARGIPVRVLNVRRPEAAGTVVNGVAAGGALRPAAFACKRGVTVLEIAAHAATAPPLFLRRVFEAFDRAEVQPCVTTTADARVIAAFDGDARVGEVTAAIAETAHVTIRTDMALLSAVGETVRTTPRLAADLLAALDGLPVHGVSHPPTGLSLTVFLEDADLAVAVNRVYDWFYRDLERAAP